MKMKSNNKGITLIALVITIIVMLILVAVTISMAVNGGLFDYAGRAVSETNNALKAEQAIADGGIEVDGVWYDSIDDYLAGKPAGVHSWTRSGDEFTCSHCNATYTMGQVVSYDENSETNSVTSTAATNGDSEQTIAVVDTTWVVLGMEDTDGDDVNETLLITTQAPVSSLTLYGAEAYNNGPDEINRICKELYSNSEYGEARGMTIADVNAALNYTPLGGYYYNSGWKTTGNLTTKLSALTTYSTITGNGTETPDGTALGDFELNGYYYYVNELNLANPVDSTTSEITEIERSTIFGPYDEDAGEYSYYYWLASRGVRADSGYAYFGPGYVFGGYAYSYRGLFDSRGVEGFYNAGLRPVVSLTSKLPVSE